MVIKPTLFLTQVIVVVISSIRRAFGATAVLKNEDPFKLSQLKEAPIKSLDDLLSTQEKHEGLITVDKKVGPFIKIVFAKNFIMKFCILG